MKATSLTVLFSSSHSSRLRILLSAILTVVTYLNLYATVINVPGDYPTIQQGIDASVDGDTVLVQPGTYVENINFNGHNIVVGSLFLTTEDTSYISSTIIDGNQAGTVVKFNGSFDNTTVISGFTIQNGRDHNYSAGIFCPQGANPTIINNIITGNWLFTEFLAGAGISCYGSSPLIANNRISDNVSIGIVPGYGGGIGCTSNSNPLIIGNIIVNNRADYGFGGGIFCYESSPIISGNLIKSNEADFGGGISCTFSVPLIINNTIVGNTSTIWGGGILCADLSYPSIKNNIVWDNGPDQIYIDEYSSPEITYNDIEGGWDGQGNIDCDPLFCDPANDNYFLQTNSCCVGAGEDGVDIGAFGVGCADPCEDYVIGDFNGSGEFNIADIVDSFSKLKIGEPEAALICECPPESGDSWAIAADVNNSCSFNVADVIAGFSKLKTGSPELVPCEQCPPEEP